MNMLWFWRGNFEVGDPVDLKLPPQLPICQLTTSRVGPNVFALSELTLVSREHAPQFLKFPDNSTKPIKHWRDLLRVVVEWLVETRRLAAKDCPLTSPRGTHYVHSSPERRDGNGFADPIFAKGLWIDGHGSASHHVRLSRYILQARGVDPSTVEVEKNPTTK